MSTGYKDFAQSTQRKGDAEIVEALLFSVCSARNFPRYWLFSEVNCSFLTMA